MGSQGFKPNPYIVARFFERLRRGKLKRTQLQMATGMKWADFTRYLARLVDLDLLGLEEEGGEQFIVPTAKGMELYHSLLKVLGELNGNLEG